MFDFLSKKFSDVITTLTAGKKLTEHTIAEALDNVRNALVDADVPYDVVQAFTERVKSEALGKKVLSSVKPGDQFVKIVYDQLLLFLGGDNTVPFSFQLPAVVMVMGLQGSGKTTSIAKMARFAQKQAEKKGKKRYIMFTSVDFYRPAAIDQLEILAGTVGATFFRPSSTEPIAAVKESIQHFKNGGYELLFLDTAGRLHIDDTMMQELKTIDTIVQPRYKMLVLDAMTGQESLAVAKSFDERVGFHGAMLTKIDSDTRGGAAFAFRYVIKKPILFIGTGEKPDDLDLFRPDRVAGRILGMGDVLSLVERAEEQVRETDRQALERSLRSGNLTLADFASQMDIVQNMGSISSLMKYLPGISSVKVSPEMMEKAEQEMRQFKAIISSMTPKERVTPAIIDASRKNRIAKGAGSTVALINLLLQRFEESKQYVKLFKKLGRF